MTRINSWSSQEDLENALAEMQEEVPAGWYDWDSSSRYQYVKNRRRLAKRKLQATRSILRRAEKEHFEATPLKYVPPSYELRETPRYVIRAVYGPLNMLAGSTLVAFEHDEDLLKRRLPGRTFLPHMQRTDAGSPWGPRQFLHNMFSMVAELHGDCVLYLVHNGAEIRVDAEDFARWVTRSQADPATALLDTMNLLEGPTP